MIEIDRGEFEFVFPFPPPPEPRPFTSHRPASPGTYVRARAHTLAAISSNKPRGQLARWAGHSVGLPGSQRRPGDPRHGCCCCEAGLLQVRAACYPILPFRAANLSLVLHVPDAAPLSGPLPASTLGRLPCQVLPALTSQHLPPLPSLLFCPSRSPSVTALQLLPPLRFGLNPDNLRGLQPSPAQPPAPRLSCSPPTSASKPPTECRTQPKPLTPCPWPLALGTQL